MSIHRLTSLFETAQIYKDILSKYNHKAKKAFLTRELKRQDEFIADIREAVTRVAADGSGRPSMSRGWFLGEKYYNHHLAHYIREREMLARWRAELDNLSVLPIA